MKLPSHFNSVKGFIDHNEGICLYNYALNSSKKGPILEIGSYCGKSTIYIATAAKKYSGCVYSVDHHTCLLYTSPSPRDRQKSRMPSSA